MLGSGQRAVWVWRRREARAFVTPGERWREAARVREGEGEGEGEGEVCARVRVRVGAGGWKSAGGRQLTLLLTLTLTLRSESAGGRQWRGWRDDREREWAVRAWSRGLRGVA